MLLDVTDKKILSALCRGSRKPLSRLARDSGLTREVVEYRIERLVAEGIIARFAARVNQANFCAGVAQLRVKLLRADSKHFEKIVAAVSSHPSVNWAAELCGSADIVMTIFYADSSDLSKTVSELIQVMGDTVRQQDLSIYITEYKYDIIGLVDQDEESLMAPVTFTGLEPVSLDKQDLHIIDILVNDCRTKASVIAKQVNLSEDVVRQRIRRFEKEGIITGYTILVDAAKCGFEYYYMRLQINPFTDEVSAKLGYYAKTNPYITYCCHTVGDYNVVLSIVARDHAHFIALLLELRELFGSLLTDYDFQLLVRELKGVYLPERATKLALSPKA